MPKCQVLVTYLTFNDNVLKIVNKAGKTHRRVGF